MKAKRGLFWFLLKRFCSTGDSNQRDAFGARAIGPDVPRRFESKSGPWRLKRRLIVAPLFMRRRRISRLLKRSVIGGRPRSAAVAGFGAPGVIVSKILYGHDQPSLKFRPGRRSVSLHLPGQSLPGQSAACPPWRVIRG